MSSTDEFVDYFSSMAREKAMEEARREAVLRHEIWEQTTILGRVSKWTKDMSGNRFFEAVTDAFRDQKEGSSVNVIILFNIARISLIVMAIVSVMYIGRIIQTIIGEEIIVEEEIEIIEEIPIEKKKNRRNAKTRAIKEE